MRRSVSADTHTDGSDSVSYLCKINFLVLKALVVKPYDCCVVYAREEAVSDRSCRKITTRRLAPLFEGQVFRRRLPGVLLNGPVCVFPTKIDSASSPSCPLTRAHPSMTCTAKSGRVKARSGGAPSISMSAIRTDSAVPGCKSSSMDSSVVSSTDAIDQKSSRSQKPCSG